MRFFGDDAASRLAIAIRRRYRASGGDLPGGDPRPSHGAEMEGYFWRITDAASGRVLVALCGVNRHPDGDWATVALARHPGTIVRSAVVALARAASDHFSVTAGDVLDADADHLRVRLDGDELDVRFHDRVDWPLRLGGGGVFAALPFLGQYWHPHVLGGRADGEVVIEGEPSRLDGAVYAEKNWGAGFPDRWWWGQAHDFGVDDACVAFGGGRLRAGRVSANVGGCIVRLGRRTIRFAPPMAIVRSRVADGTWHIDARRPGWRVVIEGGGGSGVPHVLPVPIPSERRNVPTDLEHLAGRLHVCVMQRGRTVFDGTSELAGLEVGSVDGQVATTWPTWPTAS